MRSASASNTILEVIFHVLLFDVIYGVVLEQLVHIHLAVFIVYEKYIYIFLFMDSFTMQEQIK